VRTRAAVRSPVNAVAYTVVEGGEDRAAKCAWCGTFRRRATLSLVARDTKWKRTNVILDVLHVRQYDLDHLRLGRSKRTNFGPFRVRVLTRVSL
jgi:hypothetical protein